MSATARLARNEAVPFLVVLGVALVERVLEEPAVRRRIGQAVRALRKAATVRAGDVVTVRPESARSVGPAAALPERAS